MVFVRMGVAERPFRVIADQLTPRPVRLNQRAMLPHCVAQGIYVVLHLFKKECSRRMWFLYVAFCDLCEVVRDVSVAIFRFVGPT